MNQPTRTALWLSAIIALTTQFSSRALAEEACDQVAADFSASVTAHPEVLLPDFARVLAANESCACELVKAAIGAAGSNKAMVGDIVFTAVSLAPGMAVTITECAVAAAPKATGSIKAGLKRALTDKGSEAYGKEVYGKNVGDLEQDTDSEGPTLDPRGVYLAGPSSWGTQEDASDYSFGESPSDIRGIYLVTPSGGGASAKALSSRERKRARQAVERITTIVRTIRRPGGTNPGSGNGDGNGITPSDPIPVRETRTVTQPETEEEPIITGSSSGTESMLPMAAASSKQRVVSSASSIVRPVSLTPGQIESVRARAQDKVDRLVAEELEIMGEESGSGKSVVIPPRKPSPRTSTESRKQAVSAETDQKIAAVRQEASKRRAAATTPKQTSKIDAEEGQALYQLEQDATKEQAALESAPAETAYTIAVQRVRQKYGSSIVVPVEGPGMENVVAFASVDSIGVVSVARSAYELDHNPVANAVPRGSIVAATIQNQNHILVLPSEE